MKAIVFHKYGSPDVLNLEEVRKPVPKDNEVLIKIHAATVTAGDCEMREFDFPLWLWLLLRLYMGLFKPRIKILGQELAGEIEAIGKDVTDFKAGDQIFAPTEMSLGAYAEYICLPDHKPIALKPANMTFEEAATLPTGGLNALHFLEKANINSGQSILINGAGGSIGTYAIQMAKAKGAEVTAVDSSEKLAVLQTIGADMVIDYKQMDFTKSGKNYDVILDVVGKGDFSGSLKSLKTNGRLIIGNPRPTTMIRGFWASLFGNKKVINAVAPYKKENLLALKKMVEAGTIKAVIDKSYRLEEMVDAHLYVETGLKTGHVVITVVER